MGQDVSSGFSSRLRNLRESRSYRQDDIAELFGMNKSAVSQWENGRIPHSTIVVKLADFFSVSTDYLLCRTDNPQGIQEKLATPEDTAGENLSDPVLDEIADNLKKMSPEEREAVRRLTQSVANRETKSVG